jgi:hypothetical protein
LKNIAIICTSDFINNTAGGGSVFHCNLKSLYLLYNNVDIYMFDVLSCKVLKYIFTSNEMLFQEEYINLSFFKSKKRNMVLKFITYLSLSFKYNFFWVEHFYALPSYKLTPNFIFKKIIYSQHDFLFKIKSLKNNTNVIDSKTFFEEKKTISKCKLLIAGNQIEVNYSKNEFKIPSYYLPIAIEKIIKSPIVYDNKIVHLGSFNTTASLNGFLHFKNNILPFFTCPIQTLLVGSGTEIFQDINIKGLGFQHNLSEILQTGTISIIPWQFDSGQRTRVFELLSFGCIIVSYKVLGEIIPELTNNVNCILVENEIEFATKIEEIIINKNIRNTIANNALKLAEYFNYNKRVLEIEKIINS